MPDRVVILRQKVDGYVPLVVEFPVDLYCSPILLEVHERWLARVFHLTLCATYLQVLTH